VTEAVYKDYNAAEGYLTFEPATATFVFNCLDYFHTSFSENRKPRTPHDLPDGLQDIPLRKLGWGFHGQLEAIGTFLRHVSLHHLDQFHQYPFGRTASEEYSSSTTLRTEIPTPRYRSAPCKSRVLRAVNHPKSPSLE
jgi:hypothetical protein